jgi:N-methylhydantoinase A/oxoprolinase/acetone carboxylase beta subunit
MTWLINVDNGGTTTGFCLVDGGEERYTKTLTTPSDLSRCLFDGLAKASERGARRLVIAASGSDSADGEARAKGCTRHLLGAVPLLFSWELVADPLRYPRTWSSLLNAFLHPASERFLFNADRRLRDARARQPSRIFRRRLTACSPRRGACPEAVMKQVRSLARPVPAWPPRTPGMRSSL